MDTKLCTRLRLVAIKIMLVLSQQQAWIKICMYQFPKGRSTYLGSVIRPPPFNLQPPKERTDTRAGIFLLRGTDTQTEQKRRNTNSYHEREENIETPTLQLFL